MRKVYSKQTFSFQVNGGMRIVLSPQGVVVTDTIAELLKQRFGALISWTIYEVVDVTTPEEVQVSEPSVGSVSPESISTESVANTQEIIPPEKVEEPEKKKRGRPSKKK